MANRRMFSRDVVETDRFLGMPLTAQALYFHLGVRADENGICANPNGVLRCIGYIEVDLKILIQYGFAVPEENGLIICMD